MQQQVSFFKFHDKNCEAFLNARTFYKLTMRRVV